VGFSRDANFGLNTWNAASNQAKGKSPTYLYYWTRLSPFWEGQSFQENSPASLLGAYHGSQVPYVFGTLDVLDREFTVRDRELSNLWQAYIANFVKSGNPNGTGVPDWPTFDNTSEKVLEIGDKTTVVKLPNKPQMEFFRKMVTK
jgi:para-nitrobenzyl esterase